MTDDEDVTGQLSMNGFVLIAVLVMVLLAGFFGAVVPAAGDSGPGRSGLSWSFSASQPPAVTLEGFEDGATLGGPDLDRSAVLRTEDPDQLSEAAVRLGDRILEADFDDNGEMPLPLGELTDGEHELVVEQEDTWRTPEVDERWTFTIDTQPPRLELEPLAVAVGDEPLLVAGDTDSDASVEVNDEPAEVAADGAFAAELDDVQGEESIVARATDPLGNIATAETSTAWVPSRSEVDQINALHVSIWGWSSDQLREPILEMAEEGRINTVQLDLKDEGGHIAFDTDVELANDIGANLAAWDLEEAVAELHARGVRVVGRMVAFADPVLSEHAWEAGDRDMVVQRPQGTMYTGQYAGFTSFAHDEVRQYLFDLAEEAVRAGVDDILWDYIRRPDGPRDEYHFGGLDEGTDPAESIVDFLDEADDIVTHYGAAHGASVYGIAATRPDQIAQDIPAMAPHVDYVSPMVYYSHWGPGEYDVPDPNADPYAITRRSLEDFVEMVEGDRARVVPWLQDFQLGGPHGEHEVREQLRAAADAGTDEWIMWDASVRYTREAYDELPEPAEEDDDVEAPGDGGVIDD